MKKSARRLLMASKSNEQRADAVATAVDDSRTPDAALHPVPQWSGVERFGTPKAFVNNLWVPAELVPTMDVLYKAAVGERVLAASTQVAPRASPETATRELPEQRKDRRLERFEAIGGRLAKTRSGSWKMVGRKGALADLAREEQTARNPRSDPREVSRELKAAAQRRLDADLK
jgi:hypothetical protein